MLWRHLVPDPAGQHRVPPLGHSLVLGLLHPLLAKKIGVMFLFGNISFFQKPSCCNLHLYHHHLHHHQDQPDQPDQHHQQDQRQQDQHQETWRGLASTRCCTAGAQRAKLSSTPSITPASLAREQGCTLESR